MTTTTATQAATANLMAQASTETLKGAASKMATELMTTRGQTFSELMNTGSMRDAEFRALATTLAELDRRGW